MRPLSISSLPDMFQPNFQRKGFSPATNVLARPPTLTQPPACSAQPATDRGEHKCGQRCPTGMVSQELDFAPAMPQFSSHLLGIVSPTLQKCSTVLGDTCCAHSFSHQHSVVTWACRKHSLSMEIVSLSITTQGKL